MSLPDALEEKLVQEVLASGEWREEHSRSSDGGTKVWYWLKKDKKVKMKNRRELGAHLRKQKEAAGQGGDAAAPPAAGGGAPKPPPKAGEAAPSSAVVPAASPPTENPDAARIAGMGVLGTDVDSMTDANELRNQVRLWEAKYRVLLDENKRLLLGEGVSGQPAAGTVVPSDLQLKYDALLRQNSALHADLEVKQGEVGRLSKAVEDLADNKAKLEVQLTEAYQQAAEGLEAKVKLQEKDDIVERAGGFVNAHYKEQNKFLAAQVSELTALLHKVKEEDHMVAKVRAASVDAELYAMQEHGLTEADRAKVTVHFHALLNSPAQHVLCGKCRATLARMVVSEGGNEPLALTHAPSPYHADSSFVSASNIHPHFDREPATLPRPAYIHNVPLSREAQPVHTIPVQATTGAPPQPAAVASFGGFIVRTKPRA